MSLLQLKNIHKRHLLWAKLLGACLFLHLVFLFWVFCVYRDNSYMLSLSIHKNLDYSTPIMFVPLGVTTTNIKSTPTKIIPKKVTADKPKPVTPVTPAKTDVKKLTTVAAPSSSAKATADTSVKTDVKKHKNDKKLRCYDV